jgi:hypothetical protein
MTLLNTADKLYLGDTEVDAVYDGAVKVWPPLPPFNPSSVIGLVGWLDASQLGLADGAPVTIWPDLSGCGVDLVAEPALGTVPSYKVNGLKGHGVVRYNGINNVMRSTVPVILRHVFMVAKYNYAVFDDYDGLLTGHDGNEIILIGHQGTTHLYGPPWGGNYRLNGISSPGLPAPLGTWGLIDFSAYDTWSLARLQIGLDRVYGPRFWDGEVAEMIGYDRNLPDGERIQVEDYLRTKWGLL